MSLRWSTRIFIDLEGDARVGSAANLNSCGHQFVKHGAEEVLELAAFLGYQSALPICRGECLGNFSLLLKRRQRKRPRLEKLDVDVLLPALRSETNHLRLLCDQVVVQELGVNILIWRNSNKSARAGNALRASRDDTNFTAPSPTVTHITSITDRSDGRRERGKVRSHERRFTILPVPRSSGNGKDRGGTLCWATPRRGDRAHFNSQCSPKKPATGTPPGSCVVTGCVRSMMAQSGNLATWRALLR